MSTPEARAALVIAKRRELGASQRDLAARMQRHGVTTSAAEISRIEQGRRQALRPDVAEALGKVLGLAVEQLGPIAVLDGSTTHRGPEVRKASKRRKPKTKLPAGWFKKTVHEGQLPKPASGSATLDLGPVPPLTPEQISATKDLLLRHDAADLIAMLLPTMDGVVAA